MAIESKKLKRGRRKKSFKESRPQLELSAFLDVRISQKFIKERLTEGNLEFSGDSLLQLWEICFYFQLNPIELEDKEDNQILHYGIASLEKQLTANTAYVIVWGRWLKLLYSNLKEVDKKYRARVGKLRERPKRYPLSKKNRV